MAVGHYDAPVTVTYGKGDIAAGVAHTLMRHPSDRGDGTARPIIYCHAAGTDAWAWPVESAGDLWRWAAGIVGFGAGRYCLVTVAAGDDTWGNAASCTTYAAALDWVQDAGGARTGPAAIIGGSMGGISGLNVARELGAARVVGMVGLHPTADLRWQRGTDGTLVSANLSTYNPANRNGPHYASINSAYGGNGATPTDSTFKDGDYTAINATRNPTVFVPDSCDIPYLALYNSGDTIIGATSTNGVGNRVANLAGRFTRGEARAVSASSSHNEIFSTPLEVLAFLDSLPWR